MTGMMQEIGNPILAKELRTRMRGTRAFWILFIYLGFLSGVLLVTYYAWIGFSNSESMAFSIGKQFYSVIFIVQAALIGLITPALTSGALSLEREQRTYEVLAITRLARRSIILGKLFAALAFVLLLLIGSIPLVAICFLLGGVSPAEIAAAYLLLTASAFLYGATGLTFSSFAKTTASATVLTYGTILLFFGATLPLTLMGAEPFAGATPQRGAACLVAVNPVGAMAAGATVEHYFGIALPAWLTALAINLLLGTIMTVAALHRVEYPRTDRSLLLRGLTAVAAFGLTALICGSFPSMIALGSIREGIAQASLIVALVPVVFVPLFATGDGRPVQHRFLALHCGDAPSGLTFALFIASGCGLILAASCQGNNCCTWLPAGNTLAATLGFGALGLRLSDWLGNRGSALAVTAVAMGLLYTLPYSEFLSQVRYGLSECSSTILALSPLAGVETIRQTSSAEIAAMSIAIYAGMGVLLLALPRRRQTS